MWVWFCYLLAELACFWTVSNHKCRVVRAVVAVRFGKLFASLPLIHTICEPRYNTRHSTTDKLTISQDNKYLDYLLGLYIELGTYATGSLVISCENRANLLAELTIPRGTPRKKKTSSAFSKGENTIIQFSAIFVRDNDLTWKSWANFFQLQSISILSGHS